MIRKTKRLESEISAIKNQNSSYLTDLSLMSLNSVNMNSSNMNSKAKTVRKTTEKSGVSPSNFDLTP